MDKFNVPGRAGGIVLGATAQANAKKAARRLDLIAALKAAFRACGNSLFPHVKPARQPRNLATVKFVVNQAQLNANNDAFIEDTND